MPLRSLRTSEFGTSDAPSAEAKYPKRRRRGIDGLKATPTWPDCLRLLWSQRWQAYCDDGVLAPSCEENLLTDEMPRQPASIARGRRPNREPRTSTQKPGAYA